MVAMNRRVGAVRSGTRQETAGSSFLGRCTGYKGSSCLAKGFAHPVCVSSIPAACTTFLRRYCLVSGIYPAVRATYPRPKQAAFCRVDLSGGPVWSRVGPRRYKSLVLRNETDGSGGIEKGPIDSRGVLARGRRTRSFLAPHAQTEVYGE